MHSLSALQLLEAWEHGTGQTSARRALVLLAAACPEEPVEALAGLSIGQRDARLLTLREWIFGSQLSSIADCPVCHEYLEMDLKISDLRSDPSPKSGVENYRVEKEDYRVGFRLPNSLDLLAAGSSGEIESGRRILIESCLLEVVHEDMPLAASSLPAEVIELVIEQMRSADPQAEIELDLTCPACGHSWTAALDIIDYFWREIESWIQRILQEVHRLAQAYGWSEREILQMSAWRRRRYLEMIYS